MKSFKDLSIGDNLYISRIDVFCDYIYKIKNFDIKNGYIKIHYYYIPLNHKKADNIKFSDLMIFTDKFKWKKYINLRIDNLPDKL